MNAERLREAVDLLLDAEKASNGQAVFTELVSQLAQLAGAPQDATIQSQFAATLLAARQLVVELRERFTPAQMSLFDEIKTGEKFFIDIPARIDAVMQENPLTPAVASTLLSQLVSERETYVQTLHVLHDRLQEIGIEALKLAPGDADIGFMIPRSMFENNLDDLVKETKSLNTFVRIISEYATGAPEKADIRQVSTSELELLLGLKPETIVAIGAFVTWALNTLKQIAELRKLRDDMQKSSAFTKKEVEDIFGKKIDATIEKAISQKLRELPAPSPTLDKARLAELQNGLDWG